MREELTDLFQSYLDIVEWLYKPLVQNVFSFKITNVMKEQIGVATTLVSVLYSFAVIKVASNDGYSESNYFMGY